MVGRLTGVDPIAEKFGWVSVYNYAENTPVNAIDLHGLQAFFVHGLRSSSADWASEDFQRTAKSLLEKSTSVTPDFGFDWSDKATLINVTQQRTAAAYDLVNYILDNNNSDEDVTIIGVSHGGNVAIQAAKILGNFGFKVNLITLNTPQETDVPWLLGDNFVFTNTWENPLINNDGINDFIQITTKGDFIARVASTELFEYDKAEMAKRGWESFEIPSKYPWYMFLSVHGTGTANTDAIDKIDAKLSPIPKIYSIPYQTREK